MAALLALGVALLIAGCSSGSSKIAELGLQGRLVYSQTEKGLWQVDLQTGKVSRLWKPPKNALLYGVAVSPDGGSIAVGYSPTGKTEGLGWPDLYLLSGDGSDPRPLRQHRAGFESFDYPAWSPDGQWLYYTHSDVVINQDLSFGDPVVNVERIQPGVGEPEIVISNAEQASISADGSRITYLRFDLESYKRSIWMANIDGSEAVELLPETRFFDVAYPKFSPDGQLIAFAGSGPLQSASFQPEPWNLLNWLFGAQTAYAHGLPGDFWTIPITGGEPTKLTDWSSDGWALSWSPDSGNLALMRLGGLFVRDATTDPVLLTETPEHGGLDWSAAPYD